MTSKATEYTEGTLPWTTRLQIRLHLMMCWMCRRYLEQLALTIRALGHLAGRDAPTEVPAPLREAFRQWTNDRRR